MRSHSLKGLQAAEVNGGLTARWHPIADQPEVEVRFKLCAEHAELLEHFVFELDYPEGKAKGTDAL